MTARCRLSPSPRRIERYHTPPLGTPGGSRKTGLLKRSERWSAQQTAITQGDSLWFGRPYFSASDNRFLWAWLNPQLWAASLNLIVTDQVDPLPDDVFHDPGTMHVVAGRWSVEPSPTIAEHRQWNLTSEDRDTEILDYTNFYPLWVDMHTGFCRRVTGEGVNGRDWDILLDELTINEPGRISKEIFQP